MNASAPQKAPFGLWPSPISASLLSRRLRLEDVQWDSDGRTLVWLEGRAERGVLVCRRADEAACDLTVEQSVRGGIGYGGGEFRVANGRVFFAESGGRLFTRSLEAGLPRPLTPPFGAAASPVPSPDGRWLAYIFSDGVDDALALVDSDGAQWPAKLAQGADFYMQPAWHPSGKRLAWVEWYHPRMPWEGARLMLADVSSDPLRLANIVHLAGEDWLPAAQPQFSPDGRWLAYIQARGEWDDLMLLELQTGERRCLVAGEGFALALLPWVQGMRSYGWHPSGKSILHLRFSGSQSSLWQVELESGISTQLNTAPYTWITQLSVSSHNGQAAFLASAPGIPDRVVRLDEHGLHVVARSDPEIIPQEFLPAPQEITWEAPDGTPVHGLFYPPANPGCTAAGLPPAIVTIHGGPTSQATSACSMPAAFFTSRGYAWLEVNHRGSSGYGRTYINALNQRWGEADVEDAAGGAAALANLGLADARRLVIKGGSAGGYTVLNTLIRHPGLFKAGVCLYGVSNLFTLDMDTHKFEARYNDSLIGALPEAAEKYHAWSPVFHAAAIRDALAVFQGDQDRVVPPAQSEEIVAALRQNGVPHLYRLYAGEGHGFRKSETIQDFYQVLERFLQQFVLFAP